MKRVQIWVVKEKMEKKLIEPEGDMGKTRPRWLDKAFDNFPTIRYVKL